FSVGVNALFALTGRAAAIFGAQFKPEIVETHHTKKKDAPSGTAKTLGEILNRELKIDVPIESIREGDVVGEHTVAFVGPSERLELTHSAGSREIVARGALRAAQWVVGKSLNTVLEIEYDADPSELLEKLIGIEESLGRKRDHAQNVSRKIDIDILYADDLVINNERLQLPHPRLHERKFVLQPLADIR